MNTTPPIHGFHHVALRTQDFDRSVAFYQSTLGFARKIQWGQKPARAIMLSINPDDAGDPASGGILEIFERPDEIPTGQNPAFFHLCVRCSDVDAIIEQVKAQGLEVTTEPKNVDIQCEPNGPARVRLAFFKGPDGEEIELFDSQDV